MQLPLILFEAYNSMPKVAGIDKQPKWDIYHIRKPENCSFAAFCSHSHVSIQKNHIPLYKKSILQLKWVSPIQLKDQVP